MLKVNQDQWEKLDFQDRVVQWETEVLVVLQDPQDPLGILVRRVCVWMGLKGSEDLQENQDHQVNFFICDRLMKTRGTMGFRNVSGCLFECWFFWL